LIKESAGPTFAAGERRAPDRIFSLRQDAAFAVTQASMKLLGIRTLVAIMHMLFGLEFYTSNIDMIKARAFCQLLQWRMDLTWRGVIVVAMATPNIERGTRPILGNNIEALQSLTLAARCRRRAMRI
jgi:hypothetical protein